MYYTLYSVFVKIFAQTTVRSSELFVEGYSKHRSGSEADDLANSDSQSETEVPDGTEKYPSVNASMK